MSTDSTEDRVALVIQATVEATRSALLAVRHNLNNGMTLPQLMKWLDREIELDPRDPDHSRTGIFVHHNCWKCQSGAKPCVVGDPNRCEYPRARND